MNYGLLGYPVLQAADIILYKARYVPVGQDQVPHLELAREIVRRFNRIFGETFPEPQAKLTEAPLVVGLDGKDKMSKSLDNHVELAATAEETRKRVLTAFTDPQRLRRADPGRPWVCNVYSLHKLFSTPAEVKTVYANAPPPNAGVWTARCSWPTTSIRRWRRCGRAAPNMRSGPRWWTRCLPTAPTAPEPSRR